MAADGLDDDDDAVLPCGVCEHDLNHPCYRVMPHPVLPQVPVCVLCCEDLADLGPQLPKTEEGEEKEVGGEEEDKGTSEQDGEARCCWCGEGSLLFECANREQCGCSFCEDCLLNQLGQDALTEIEQDDDWMCLACDWTQQGKEFPRLKQHESNLAALAARMYSASTSASASAMPVDPAGPDPADAETEDKLLAQTVGFLTAIVAALKQAEQLLAATHGDGNGDGGNSELRAEIGLELNAAAAAAGTGADSGAALAAAAAAAADGSLSERVTAELTELRQRWQRHFDILQRQEAACHQLIAELDPRLDPFRLAAYADDMAPLDALRGGGGGGGGAGNGQELPPPPALPAAAFAQPAAPAHDWWTEPTGNYYGKELPSPARLATLAERANQHPLVLAHAAAATAPPLQRLCPPSFFRAFPEKLLQSMARAGMARKLADFEQMAADFSVPPALAVLLWNYNSKPVPQSAEHWYFAKRLQLHGSIVKVLCSSQNPRDLAVLQQRYGLDADVGAVEDFGDLEALARLTSKRFLAQNAGLDAGGAGNEGEKDEDEEKEQEQERLEQMREQFVQEMAANLETEDAAPPHVYSRRQCARSSFVESDDELEERQEDLEQSLLLLTEESEASAERSVLRERLSSAQRARTARRDKGGGGGGGGGGSGGGGGGGGGSGGAKQRGAAEAAASNGNNNNQQQQGDSDAAAAAASVSFSSPQDAAGRSETRKRKGPQPAILRREKEPEPQAPAPASAAYSYGSDDDDGGGGGNSDDNSDSDSSMSVGGGGEAKGPKLKHRRRMAAPPPPPPLPPLHQEFPLLVKAPTGIETADALERRAAKYCKLCFAYLIDETQKHFIIDPRGQRVLTAGPFLASVDRLYFPAYQTFIDAGREEMYFQLMSRKVKGDNKYGTSFAALLADVDKIHANCCAFNQGDVNAYIRAMSQGVLNYFRYLLRCSMRALRAVGDAALADLLSTPDLEPVLTEQDPPDVIAFLSHLREDRVRASEAERLAASRYKKRTFSAAGFRGALQSRGGSRFESNRWSSSQLAQLFPNPNDPRYQNRESLAYKREYLCLNGQDLLTEAQLNFYHTRYRSYFTASAVVAEAAVALKESGGACSKPVFMPKPLVPLLKDHQRAGVQFLFNHVFGPGDYFFSNDEGGEAVEATSRRGGVEPGGAILGHVMGLGKTFSIIAFLSAVMASPAMGPTPAPASLAAAATAAAAAAAASSTSAPLPAPARRRVHTALIVAPVNVIQNWADEFEKWMSEMGKSKHPGSGTDQSWAARDMRKILNVQLLVAGGKDEDKKLGLTSQEILAQRVETLQLWQEEGGVLIIGYELFSNLVGVDPIKSGRRTAASLAAAAASATAKKATTADALEARIAARLALLDPGPDLVVCDELHMVKNEHGSRLAALSAIRTKRRIGLTGSPVQNNLLEYFVMCNWARPGCLGKKAKFVELTVNPIKAGLLVKHSAEYQATERIKKMKRVSLELNRKLRGLVDRRGPTELARNLPLKRLFVLTLRMSELQTFLYAMFLKELTKKGLEGKQLTFLGFQTLLKLCNHPGALVVETLSHERKAAAQAKNKAKLDWCPPPRLDTILRELEPVESLRLLRGRELMGGKKALDVIKDLDADDEDEDDEAMGGDDDDDDDEEEDYDYDDEDEEAATNKRRKKKMAATNRQNKGKKRRDWDSDSDDSSADDNPGSGLLSGDNLVPRGWWRMREHSSSTAAASGSGGGGSSSGKPLPVLLELGAKIKVFLQLLALSCNQGDKMILFSQSKPTLDLLELVLAGEWGKSLSRECEDEAFDPSPAMKQGAKFKHWTANTRGYCRIDGETSGRQALIDKFNQDDKGIFHLFLISTRAGNMGINLQSANRVVLFDSSWNPMSDLQAMHRAYRFGQQKPVFVYRLVLHGSLEQKIYRQQIVKQQMAERVVDANLPRNAFGEEEIGGLFKFESGDGEGEGEGEGKSKGDKKGRQLLEELQQVLAQDPHDAVLTALVTKDRGAGSGSNILSVEDSAPLLQDVEEEHLNPQEEAEAERAYEAELQAEFRRAELKEELEKAAAAAAAAGTSAAAGAGAAGAAGSGAGVAMVIDVVQPPPPDAAFWREMLRIFQPQQAAVGPEAPLSQYLGLPAGTEQPPPTNN